jgi:hypothetical protein
MAAFNKAIGGVKPNGLMWITFQEASWGTWAAIAKTDEGEIAARGPTLREARLALHEKLRKLRAGMARSGTQPR